MTNTHEGEPDSPRKRERLAFLNTRLPGLNAFLVRDLQTLLRRGVPLDLYLVATEDLDPALRKEIESAGGGVFAIPFRSARAQATGLARGLLKRPFRMLRCLGVVLGVFVRSPSEGARALAALPAAVLLTPLLKKRGVAQVHAMWAGVPATLAYWLWELEGIPYGISAHAWDITTHTAMLSRKVRNARGTVVCSEWAFQKMTADAGEMKKKVHLVHHGIDLETLDFPNGFWKPDPALVLAVGRLTEKKGFEYLVGACAILHQKGLAFRCQIIGPDRSVGPRLRQMILDRGLESLVTLPGEIPPRVVRERMTEARVLVCPSVQTQSGDSDGIPNVILEAMAIGTPVVGTNVGGIGEAVLDRVTGRLVDQRDARALAEAIEEILVDPAAAESMTRHARTLLVREFSSESTADRFMDAVGLAGRFVKGGDHVSSGNL